MEWKLVGLVTHVDSFIGRWSSQTVKKGSLFCVSVQVHVFWVNYWYAYYEFDFHFKREDIWIHVFQGTQMEFFINHQFTTATYINIRVLFGVNVFLARRYFVLVRFSLQPLFAASVLDIHVYIFGNWPHSKSETIQLFVTRLQMQIFGFKQNHQLIVLSIGPQNRSVTKKSKHECDQYSPVRTPIGACYWACANTHPPDWLFLTRVALEITVSLTGVDPLAMGAQSCSRPRQSWRKSRVYSEPPTRSDLSDAGAAGARRPQNREAPA